MTSVFDASTGEMTNTFSVGGDEKVTLTGADQEGNAWEKTPLEQALETIYTDGSTGYPVPPEAEEGDGGLPPDYAYPSNPGSHGWIAWFGGSAGDSFDQGVNFVPGVGDNLTLGANKWSR